MFVQGRGRIMANRDKYTEHTDTEIKQHIADTAKWLKSMGYEGDAIMGPELQHINEQSARIAELEAERHALLKEICGICWACKKAEPVPIAGRDSAACTCEHLREMGVMAAGGKRKCEYFEWRDPAAGKE